LIDFVENANILLNSLNVFGPTKCFMSSSTGHRNKASQDKPQFDPGLRDQPHSDICQRGRAPQRWTATRWESSKTQQKWKWNQLHCNKN